MVRWAASISPRYLWQQTLRTHVDKFNNLHIVTVPSKAEVCTVPVPELLSLGVRAAARFVPSLLWRGPRRGQRFKKLEEKSGGIRHIWESAL